jgi:hypothetical protein
MPFTQTINPMKSPLAPLWQRGDGGICWKADGGVESDLYGIEL